MCEHGGGTGDAREECHVCPFTGECWMLCGYYEGPDLCKHPKALEDFDEECLGFPDNPLCGCMEE